jgi:hypothetical protein
VIVFDCDGFFQLGHTQSFVHHVLIVLNEANFTLVLGVELVLRLGEVVFASFKDNLLRHPAIAVTLSRVLSERSKVSVFA